jgi:2-oxoglutarate ferredoxin oxidoreductase subunit alpha
MSENSKSVLMKGNDAMAEAAIIAGCRQYYGYPITPQNEVPAYMARRMPEVGGVFLQSESEVAAINMVYGAAATGARVMTSSSSPGISLKQEGISYIAGAHLPCVIANVQRAGPGLGGIGAAQGDYFQAVKGGGHGDYRLVVLAPSSVQEMADLTILAFDTADRYRIPVMLLADAVVGQMTEPVVLPSASALPPVAKPWALTGARDRQANVVRSYFTSPEDVYANNVRLQEKYSAILSEVTPMCEEFLADDADLLLVGYGISGRVAKAVAVALRKEGIRAGALRPVHLWPFPKRTFARHAGRVKRFLVIEMSYGQMVEDVRLSIDCSVPVDFYGISGGFLPNEADILRQAREVMA